MQLQDKTIEVDNPQSHLDLANDLKKEGKIDEALYHYQAVVDLEDNNLSAWQQLAHIYELNKEFENADSCYQKVIELDPDETRYYIRLAKVLQQQEKNTEAISIYQKAIAIDPEQSLNVYKNLGNLLVKEGRLDESIAAYAKAVELQPENPVNYCLLAKSQARQGDIEGTVSSYQKAVELDSEKSLSFLNNIANALRQHRERYQHIWQTLNQKNIDGFAQIKYCYPTVNSWADVKNYFAQTSNYKIINLTNLTEEERLILEKNNLSVESLNLIGKDDSVAQQETYLQHFQQNFQLNSPKGKLPSTKRFQELRNLTAFQEAMLTGYMYITCPFSGKLLRTNQSFLINKAICAYRFDGDQVFYVIATNSFFEKALIYFPDRELIIRLYRNTFMETTQIIDRLKAFFVTNWQQTMSYLASDARKEVAVLAGIDRNLGHHIWNELTAIHDLQTKKLLGRADKFLLPPYDVFGRIEDIFPEIPAPKIIRSADISGDQLGNIALENNYFVVRPRGLFIKEDLADRIYQLSRQNCSPSTLSQIEVAQQHSPLIWIDLRLNKRFWNSQLEGTAKIIQKLAEDFPNLGVVFDGFSRLAKDLDYGNEDVKQKQAVIDQERAVVEQIASLVTDCNVKIYNNVGCSIYESVVWAHAIDLYIAHWGAGLTKTTFLANKPGVVHTNQVGLNLPPERRFYCYERENGIVPTFVPQQSVVDTEDSSQKYISYSYDCDWQVIYDQVVKLYAKINRKTEQKSFFKDLYSFTKRIFSD
ncbi:tetratricopeptide repeat protein [Xenococcus sp. PCC 7305]|uniref:tetratricopeptide repeat protein n=1 Tax=Xenococcus sp. PCC 7305 TaxID=102125 RepID=UPI0002AC0B62|nr:tetratricopeptide repeat protein [Xenococcus sp. PCC 7305]ELS04913.1 tetratricopeptide repeat protein [Xenococcus sp. PCC 7305]